MKPQKAGWSEHLPYRGAVPALTDVIAGHVDIFFDTPTTSVPLFREGKVRILALADGERLQTLPEVPTFSEAGLPGFKSITWFGMAAPPGTPAPVAEQINRDVVAILMTREVSEQLAVLSFERGATSRAGAAKFFAEETALWGKVIREAAIPMQ